MFHKMSTQEEQRQDRKPSITEFDRQLVDDIEKKTVSDCSLNELLMVLIRRGESNQNPVLIGSTMNLLKSLNGEFKRFHRFNGPRRDSGNERRDFNNERTHPMVTRSQVKKEKESSVEDTASDSTSRGTTRTQRKSNRKYND